MEKTVVVKGPVLIDSTWITKQKVFKDELLSNPRITHICRSFFVPGDKMWFSLTFREGTNPDPGSSRTVVANFVDEGFMDLYGLKLLAGRNFDNTIQSDVYSIDILGSRQIAPKDFLDNIYSNFFSNTFVIAGMH